MDFKPVVDVECLWFIQAYETLKMFGKNGITLTDIVTYWQNVGRIGSLDEFILVITKIERLKETL